MGTWLKANGGPPALVIVGVGLIFGWAPLGIAVTIVGAGMWLYAHESTGERLPTVSFERGDGWTIRLRPPARLGKKGLRDETAALVDDIRKLQIAWGRSNPADFAAAKLAAEAASALGADVLSTRSTYDQVVLDRLTGERRVASVASLRGRIAGVAASLAQRGLMDPAEADALAGRFLPSPDAASVRLAAVRELPTADRLEQLISQL
ncbi:MAG: hypothetical protein QOK34_1608 [Gaiellaceae bacterium]|jgi:hypothetical protein|nr:hypothetical protein [Gaiellaceae bacterium]